MMEALVPKPRSKHAIVSSLFKHEAASMDYFVRDSFITIFARYGQIAERDTIQSMKKTKQKLHTCCL